MFVCFCCLPGKSLAAYQVANPGFFTGNAKSDSLEKKEEKEQNKRKRREFRVIPENNLLTKSMIDGSLNGEDKEVENDSNDGSDDIMIDSFGK